MGWPGGSRRSPILYFFRAFFFLPAIFLFSFVIVSVSLSCLLVVPFSCLLLVPCFLFILSATAVVPSGARVIIFKMIRA